MMLHHIIHQDFGGYKNRIYQDMEILRFLYFLSTTVDHREKR